MEDLEEKRAYDRDWRKRAYYDRKARQVCIECKADLQDDDGLRCGECETKNRERKHKSNTSERGREHNRQRDSKMRDQRRADGQCIRCGAEAPLVPGDPHRRRTHCETCRAKVDALTKAWRRRKAAGIVVLSTVRQKRAKAKPDHVGYTPIEELASRPRRRVMRALLRLEWARSIEICEALEVEDDETAADAVRSALVREVRRGTIERRGERFAYQYNLTDAGRAAARELAEIRA